MPVRELQSLPKANQLLVKRAATRWLAVAAILHPVNAIVLNHAGRDFAQHLRAEKWNEVERQAAAMTGDIKRAALSLRDDLELVDVPFRRFLEGLAGLNLAARGLALEGQEPVLSNVLCLGKAFLFCTVPELLAANAGAAPPFAAACAAVKLDLAAKYFVYCLCHSQHPLCAKLC